MNLIDLATPGFFAAMGIEHRVLKKRAAAGDTTAIGYERKDTIASLLMGTAGLFRLNLQRHPAHGDAAQKPMDLGFIALLFLTSLSGLALWLGGQSAAMPTLLAVAVAISVLEGAITCHLLSVDGQLHARRPLSSPALVDETRVVPHRVCTTI